MSHRRYSLWLMPDVAARERFAALIAMLSTRFGTLPFEPHVTLLGALAGDETDLRRRTRTLARELVPFEVRLLEAKGLDEFYRCLFVEAALGRGLPHAYAAACRIFEQALAPDYYPHLSLIYGNLTVAQKTAVLGEIDRMFDEHVRLEVVALYETGGAQWRCVERSRLGATG